MFQLGNSSGVRKRVTVLLHDGDFSDLAACTFWLPPGQPLLTYSMKAYTTKSWTNANLALYGATVGVDQWIRFDNASLHRVPAAVNAGAECIEPITSIPPLSPPAATGTSAAPAPVTRGPMDPAVTCDHGRVRRVAGGSPRPGRRRLASDGELRGRPRAAACPAR